VTPTRCPYYSYHAEAEPLITPDSSDSDSAVMAFLPYCRHKHSPAPAHVVLYSPGGQDLLKCGGDLSKCQIPRALQLDLS
jgi:hypothetical protein